MRKGLFIEPLTAKADYLVTAEEIDRANTFGSACRRSEYLTWRTVVRRNTDPQAHIAYSPSGAPYLPDHPEIHISISHCDGWVAVCISDHRCAVDIEPALRNFSRVETRYISPDERILSTSPLLPAVVWCAKETLYKLAGQEGLDFLMDLHITALDLSTGSVTGTIRKGKHINLTVKNKHGLVIVYTLG